MCQGGWPLWQSPITLSQYAEKKTVFFCRCICHHVFIFGHLYWHGLVFFGFFALGEGGRAGLPFGLLSCHMKARSKKRRGRLFDMADVELEKCGSDRSVAPKKERGSLALPLHLGEGNKGTKIILGFFLFCLVRNYILPPPVLHTLHNLTPKAIRHPSPHWHESDDYNVANNKKHSVAYAQSRKR